MLSEEIRKVLSPGDGCKLVIVTVGNDLRNDDGAGTYIAEKLINIKTGKFIIINAGMKPENTIDEVINIKPGRVVFIDAANFSGLPGEIKIIQKENISDFTLSTHIFPLGAIAKIIEDDTQAEIFFVCIQIKDASLGETISEKVLNSAEMIIDFLSDNI